jgi:DNA-binding MarR family transcriptional regulator
MPEGHDEQNPARRIAELLDRLGRAAHALQFVHGLNPAQWEALRFLGRANRYSRSPSTLAEYLGTTKGTASQTIRALEAKGHVQRCRDCDDRRGVSVALTTSGRRLLALDPMQDVERAVAALSSECAAHLADGLALVFAKIRSRCGQGAFGVCERCSHLIAAGAAEPARCGLTGEPISPGENELLCVNFAASGSGDVEPAADERVERRVLTR